MSERIPHVWVSVLSSVVSWSKPWQNSQERFALHFSHWELFRQEEEILIFGLVFWKRFWKLFVPFWVAYQFELTWCENWTDVNKRWKLSRGYIYENIFLQCSEENRAAFLNSETQLVTQLKTSTLQVCGLSMECHAPYSTAASGLFRRQKARLIRRSSCNEWKLIFWYKIQRSMTLGVPERKKKNPWNRDTSSVVARWVPILNDNILQSSALKSNLFFWLTPYNCPVLFRSCCTVQTEYVFGVFFAVCECRV